MKKALIAIVLICLIGQVKAQDSSKVLLKAIKDSFAIKASEKSILTDVNAYFSLTNDLKRKDSLYQEVAKMYPNGTVAAFLYFNEIFSRESPPSDSEMNVKAFLAIKPRFSSVDFTKSTNPLSANYNQIRYMYFSSFIDQDSALTMEKVYPELKTCNDLNMVAWYVFEKGTHIKLAEKIAKDAVDKGLVELSDSSKVPKENRAEWKKYSMTNYAMALDTYSQILAKEGNFNEAKTAQKEAILMSDAKEATLNNNYISLLFSGKEFDSARIFGERIFFAGNGDKNTINLLDSLFVIQNPNKSSKEYIKTLEKKGLEGQLLDIDGPSFSLKDLNGNIVNSNNLKDKIVVMDFWATWCGPCKASFPGMQLAVNKYKDNKNIVFLFVDTFERFSDPNQRHKAVSTVMKDMKLNFQVLLDQPDKGNNYLLASKLNFNSIPTKFILKNGKIKFKLTGFAGSDEAVLDEMDQVLEYLN
ncbi:MAG: hypothetical protein DI598_05105 [Pseudopedobacter saltans]|uniref:Thioredoxin domain-containing protein n=1 Tax=Pseudopedobacter saltans TaxID=151895 RepID=A0A2W5F3F9_9SPHI|nr:MAG: hypothetical protein DI598_05105 [Pseudopedobacter saltans]